MPSLQDDEEEEEQAAPETVRGVTTYSLVPRSLQNSSKVS